MLFRVALFLLIISNPATLLSSDLEKEKRWADEVVDSIIDGDELWLKTKDGSGDHEFLTIYTEAEFETEQETNVVAKLGIKRGMIVVHGTGIHPNWSQIVQPVRVELSQMGWNTLSVQMPVLPNQASITDYASVYPEVIPRFKSAERYLKEQGVNEIVIVAHSQGAVMAGYYLLHSDSSAEAFIAIGMPLTPNEQGIDTVKTLKKLSIPVLDIYGSDDLAAVLSVAEEKRKASVNNKGYSQVEIKDANHFFDEQNEVLISTISQWLKKNLL